MTRKAIREELVSIFTAEGSFTLVLGYLPLDLRGASKVLCIYTDDTRHNFMSAHMNDDLHHFFLDTLVKRGNSADHEDDLDDLHEVVRDVIRANIGNANWDELQLEEASDALFGDFSGVPYRVEQHRLQVKETLTS